MNIQLDVTKTFERTWDLYKECKNQAEIEESPHHVVKPIFKYRQIVSMGGTRSSKSWSILQILLLEMIERDNIKITVWRNLKNVCRTSVLEDFRKIIMANFAIFKDMKENKQLGSFEYLPTGSRIVFEGADSEGKVLGSAQDIAFFNEITEMPKAVYLQITQRTADRIFCDYNPSKNFWLDQYRFDEDTVFLHSTFHDNAYCPPNIIKQVMGYEPWENGSYKIDGANLSYKGQPISKINQPPPNTQNIKRGTADEYWWLVYGLGIGAEKPNKIYKGWREITEEEFEDLEHTSYFGLDFGAHNPTACIEVKYDDGCFYIRERMYKPLEQISDSLPTYLKLKIPDIIKGTSILICDSAKNEYINLLSAEGYFAIGAIKGGGSVEVGITLGQQFQIYYVKTLNLQFEYDNYSWQIDRYGKSTDVPDKTDDHLMDAMRYIITYLVRYLDIKL